jgi:ribonuclease BN (tRNA processing enzyme)
MPTTPGFRIRAMRVRHPAVTMGYRLERTGGPAVVYVTDDELGPGGEYEVPKDWRRRFVAFCGGADLLIHDATYTPEEYPGHIGWGHSTWHEAIELAHEAGAKRLALFHHDPEHADTQMDEIVKRAQDAAARRGRLEVFAATEGQTLAL